MGFIYRLMDAAKEKIAFNYGDVKRKYITHFGEKNRCKMNSETSSTFTYNSLLS